MIESTSRVFQIAWPIILSNITVPLIGAVDTAVVGHLPDPLYLNAVAIGSVIFSYLFWGFGFLRMGTTGLAAQAWGAGNQKETGNILLRALLLSFAIALVIIALQAPLGGLMLTFFDISPAIQEATWRYFEIRIWGAPFTLANYVFIGWLIGQGKTRIVLLTQISTYLVNMVLDLFFVMVLDWDVAGVALASVIAEVAGLTMALALTRPWRVFSDNPVIADIFHLPSMKRLMALNGGIFFRTLALLSGFTFFTRESAQLGEVILAANTVLMNFQNIMAYGLDGFAHAAESLIGQAVGADNRRRFKEALWASTLWATLVAVLFTLFYWFLGTELINLLTDIPEIRAQAREYLPWMILMPLFAVWCFQLDGIFLGATRTTEMAVATLAAVVLFIISSKILTALWNNHGLWCAFLLFMVFRALTLAAFRPLAGTRFPSL